MFKNWKHDLCSKSIKKYCAIYKIVLPFHFTIVCENLVQIGSLVTEIQKFGKNVCSILYGVNSFERYSLYEKRFFSKIILVFDVKVSIPNIAWIGLLSENLKMFDFYHFYGAQVRQRWIFTWGQFFFLITLPKPTFLPNLMLLTAM